MLSELTNKELEVVNDIEKFVRQSINELETTLTPTGKITNKTRIKAMKIIKRLENALSFFTKQLKEIKNWDIARNAAFDAEYDIKAMASATILKQLNTAISTSEEFKYPIYYSRLQLAILYSAYNYTNVTNIFNIRDANDAEIKIDADGMFGNISEWISAIKTVRESEQSKSESRKRDFFQTITTSDGKKIKRKLPDAFITPNRTAASLQKSADMFYEKIFLPGTTGTVIMTSRGKQVSAEKQARYAGKYLDILNQRFNLCSSPAPFWSILDKGTIALGASGVIAKPVQTRTDFILKAENDLKDLFIKFFKKAEKTEIRDKHDARIRIEEEIQICKNAIQQINQLLENPETKEEILDRWEKTAFTEEQLAKVTKEQLAKIEQVLVEQGELYFLGKKEKRLSLGYVGGKQIRPRVSGLLKELATASK